MLSAFLLAAVTLSSILPDNPTITTLAGNGIAGIRDGAAQDAEFLMPSGLAFGPDGTLFISDSAAQRIRLIDQAGIVRTLAGNGALPDNRLAVPGGYVDGNVNVSRFNRPTGLAVDASGAIYIADEGNHAIRKISAGIVTTVSGSPNRPIASDGAAGSAAFSNPRAVAVDTDGTLYIADTGVGIRRVDRDGNVTTLKFPGLLEANVTDVAFLPGSELLFATDEVNVAAISIHEQRVAVRFGGIPAEGGIAFGAPTAVAPVDFMHAVYSDAFSHAVRYVAFSPSSTYSRALSALRSENPQAGGGGFADGVSTVALFDDPLTIRVDPRGGFVVADAGNKRLRHISDFNGSSGDTEPNFALGDRQREYRFAILGNSFAFTGTAPSDTIAGQTALALNATPTFRTVGKLARGYSIRKFGIDGASARDYIREYLSDGQVDSVVLIVNSQWINAMVGRPGRGTSEDLGTKWQTAFAKQLSSIANDLAKSHVRLLVVAQPFPYEVSPLEAVFSSMAGLKPVYIPQESSNDYTSFGDRFLAAIRSSGVSYVDGWSVLVKETRSAQHKPLYGTSEQHLTAHGNAVLGEAIAQAMLATHTITVSTGAAAASR